MVGVGQAANQTISRSTFFSRRPTLIPSFVKTKIKDVLLGLLNDHHPLIMSKSILADLPLFIPRDQLPSLPICAALAFVGAPLLFVVLNIIYQLVSQLSTELNPSEKTCAHFLIRLTSLSRPGQRTPLFLLSSSTTSHGSDLLSPVSSKNPLLSERGLPKLT